MKRTLYILLITLFGGLISCDDLLDKYPQSGPASSEFFSTEAELTLALNAAYSSLYWMSAQDVQYQLFLDGATEMVYIRGTYANMNVIQAGQANAQTGVFESVWAHFYAKIALCNNILDNMSKAKENVSETFYNQIEAQARFLRAYNYMYLVFLYGDVPFVEHMLDWEDCKLPKTAASEIIARLYEDLDFCYMYLPSKWSDSEKGRVTKDTAIALKARIALYNGDYALAAESAKKAMDGKVYSMNDTYADLFLHAGKTSNEIMLSVQYMTGVQINANAKYIGTRISNGYSVIVPTQTLIDTYQCTDGQRIDKSTLYNPKSPFENRDPRLDYSIIRPGGWHNNYKFECHPDSTKTSAIINGVLQRVSNTDATNAYATFTGYVGRKYFDAVDLPAYISQSELPFIVMRYAEVLLTYAEAKIELGEIDQTVVDAINAVRGRKDVNMPAVNTAMSQEELRAVVRYERTVEFAMEGLHLFDIRRWKTAEYLLTGKLLGKRVKDHWYDSVVPSFNEYGKPVYPDESIFNSLGNLSFNPTSDYLWPIPQTELELNPNLK